MTQQEFFSPEKKSKYATMGRDVLERQCELLEVECQSLISQVYSLKEANLSAEQLQLITDERIAELANKIFGRSSEKLPKNHGGNDSSSPKKSNPRKKNLRERYPGVSVRIEEISLDKAPDCSLCGKETLDTGLRETAQQLTVIPKKFEIVETSRVIYGCSCCHGGMVTTPAPARIMEGSSYSDEMILDVGLSKYVDLLPIDRYVKMAARQGVRDLPPQSLIECTHYLAFFMIHAYERLKGDILSSLYLSADETPHRMLEGSDKKGWYLWGFSNETSCYFECHDTRSGDVSIDVLKYSLCEVLLSDKYSGYDRTVREVNLLRESRGLPLLQSAYCNAHSRRYFFKIMDKTPEAEFYVKQYAEIYRINKSLLGQPPDQIIKGREPMRPIFEGMRLQAEKDVFQFSEKSKMGRSLRYFLNGYKGFTLCLEKPIALDNNRQEAHMRSPVVGRKMWYGTHSERGARTACVLFSLSESCKLNRVNPREYFPAAVAQIKQRKTPMTPAEFKKSIKSPLI